MKPVETKELGVRRDDADAIGAEANVVGAWLARSGILAILIGAGFAFKYAIDRGFIGPTARVAVGLATAGAFVAWGEWARRRGWDLFAQAVTGGGLAMGYLSVLAAVQLYQLVPASAGFAALVLITAAGGALALRHDSAALAALALVGAFLNPFLVATRAEPLAVPTFSYLVAVNLIVVAGAFRRWRGLSALAFSGTLVVFAIAQQSASATEAAVAATVLFALFTMLPFATPRAARPEDLTISVLAVVAYLPYIEHLVSTVHPGREGLATLGLAATYAGLGGAARMLRPADAVLARAMFSLAAAAAIVAVPLLLEGPAVPAVWAAQGAVLMSFGRRARFIEGTVAGGAMLEIATVLSFDRLIRGFDPERLLVSGEGASALVVVASLFAAALALRSSDDEGLRRAAVVPALTGTVFALAWLSAEVVTYAGRTAQPGSRTEAIQFALSTVWAAYGALVLAVGVRARIRAARLFGLALFAVVVSKLVLNDVWLLSTGLRTVAFMVVGVALLGSSVLYQRLRDLIAVEDGDAPRPGALR